MPSCQTSIQMSRQKVAETIRLIFLNSFLYDWVQSGLSVKANKRMAPTGRPTAATNQALKGKGRSLVISLTMYWSNGFSLIKDVILFFLTSFKKQNYSFGWHSTQPVGPVFGSFASKTLYDISMFFLLIFLSLWHPTHC